MTGFDELYREAVTAAVKDDMEALTKSDYDTHSLDCLLNPKAHPPVVRLGECNCGDDKCTNVCFYNALSRDEDGNVKVLDNCIGCGDCIEACESHNLVEIKEVVPIFELIKKETPIYALIAPAYLSQFGADMTPGRLRSAFKMLGFAGLIEVALFADILTLKEALEFDAAIQKEEDFVLTSCCCPLWIGMIEKVYAQLTPHIPPSVSPMVASGRAVKKLHPDAKTVFIGPCIAKKAEARQADIADAVDYVLTFKEMADIFDAAGINPNTLEEDLRDHSSAAGRIYARTGGVSKAVADTVERIAPDRKLPVKARQANGVPECKALLKEIMQGHIDANFIEGMGCVGGCVGGPRIIIDKDQGTKNVNEYAAHTEEKTPVDNPFVFEMLRRLGFESTESLLKKQNMFIRNFDKRQ